MEKKYWLLCGILAGIVTVTLIILAIVLPSTKESSAESESKEHSTPGKDNTNLWATFPGELNTKTFHTFSFYEYADGLKEVTIKDKIKLEEKTKYDNFEFSDTIKFDAVSNYSISKEEPKEKNDKFKTLSLGLFETLETLSNPKDYQQGINSLFYLNKKAFQSSDIFLRHLCSYKLYSTIKEEDIRNNILKGIDTERQDKIIKGDSQYCLKDALGFDYWVKLIGKNDEILKANWLHDTFGLNYEEINSIFSKEEYLYKYWIEFNAKLASDFKCKQADFCGNEIIYNQLISGNVIKSILGEKNSLVNLYTEINKDYYPFESSPELFIFYNVYKAKHSDAKEYKDYTLTVEQLEKLIDEASTLSLLSSKNSAFFLSKLASNDINSIMNKYGINEVLPSFIKEYIYEYLPKLLLYREFKEGQDTYTITPLIKTYSTMAFDSIKKTYYPISQLDNLFNKIYSTLVFNDLQNSLLIKDMDYDDEDICYLIMQQVLDDGRKALKICQDPITSFRSKYNVYKWYDPYPCVMKNETKCDMSLIEHLKNIVYITEDEIKKLYESNSFGEILETNLVNLKESLQCGDKCYDDKYLIKMQFWKSDVTKKLPGDYKCDYLCEILPELISQPYELNYFFKQKNITEDIPEESIDSLISLSPSTGNNILSEENAEAFNNIYNFEKNFALYINGKGKDIFHLFDLLNNIFLFDNIVYTEYESIEDYLQGNNKEDKRYIEYLSNGEYYNNYKPGMNKTTGFNFGINLDTGDSTSMNYDRYTIDTKVLRKIVDINDNKVMNIKKIEYDYITKNNIYVTIPVLNYESLTGNKSFIDGFEYNHEDDTIYYLDKISSGVYTFTFKEEVYYNNDINCRKYVLDVNSLDNNKDSISQKLNKPLTISTNKEGLNAEIKDDIDKENYILVEPYSNMVLESKINFVYSLNTKNYGYLYYKLENEKNYPIFTYNKEYTADVDSFYKAFPSIESLKSFKKTVTIVLIVLAVVFLAVTCFCIYKYFTHKRGRISLNKGPETSLINDSRDATLNKYEE